MVTQCQIRLPAGLVVTCSNQPCDGDYTNLPGLPGQSSLRWLPGSVLGSKRGQHDIGHIIHLVLISLQKYVASTINLICLTA